MHWKLGRTILIPRLSLGLKAPEVAIVYRMASGNKMPQFEPVLRAVVWTLA